MIVKNKKDIKNMFIVGNIVKNLLLYISKYIKEGISTGYINDICHYKIINYYKAYPAILGYMNYPKSICTSVNNVVCHGIPDYNCILKNGDIVNIDISICKNEYYSDSSKMFFVGTPSINVLKLCNITYNSIFYALKCIKNGNKINLIGKNIQKYVNYYGYSIVKNYCGHGIGKKLHEFPQILHYKNNYNFRMKTGMVFTIEPMVNLGNNDTYIDKDGWTVKTKDNSLSAQYEHTILVTENGYKILTL